MYGCLLEGKQHQSLAKPDKLKFSNEPKQNELAKQKHGVNTMHTKTCETFDMSFATPQSINSSTLLGRPKLKEEVVKMPHVQMLLRATGIN